jgi:5-methylcytosine-specific restriction endonuclease McrA
MASPKGKKKTKRTTSKVKFSRPEYTTPAYRAFVRMVRQRDSMKCQYPGCKRRNYGMEVHHIVRWQDNAALRYNPSNGILLCNRCHAKITGHEAIYASMFFQIVSVNTAKQHAKESD